jgi:hypothetical protein
MVVRRNRLGQPPVQASRTHQTCDAFLANMGAGGAQLRVDARSARRAVAIGVHAGDMLAQHSHLLAQRGQSSRSAVVRPSRLPSSVSACASQRRTAVRSGPSSRHTCGTDLPELQISATVG